MLFFSSIVFVHCCSVVSLIFLSVTRIVKIRFFCYPLFAFILFSHVTGKKKIVYYVPSQLVNHVPSQLYTMCFHTCILCPFTACIPCSFTTVYYVPSQLVYHVPSQLYTMSLHRSGRAFFYTLEFKEIIRRITLFYGKLRK